MDEHHRISYMDGGDCVYIPVSVLVTRKLCIESPSTSWHRCEKHIKSELAITTNCMRSVEREIYPSIYYVLSISLQYNAIL